MNKSNRLMWLVIVLAAMISLTAAAAAQENESLNLRLIRNFGYGGFGQIQGRFTMKIQDPPPDLVKVQFFIDGKPVGMDDEMPFEFKFHTSDFDEGERVMAAAGELADGSAVESNRITKIFLTSEQAWSETEGVVVPLLIGVGVLTLAGVGIPLLFTNDRNFVLGKYGPAGGAVCPRCSLPFSRKILSPNLMLGKLVRCPHCGKTSVLPRSSQQALNEAEERFLQKDGTTRVQSQADLIRQIEDSRFED